MYYLNLSVLLCIIVIMLICYLFTQRLMINMVFHRPFIILSEFLYLLVCQYVRYSTPLSFVHHDLYVSYTEDIRIADQ